MFQIRAGLFETNSSSTHTLVIVSTAEYNKWWNSRNSDEIKDMMFMQVNTIDKDSGDVKFISGEKVIEKMKKNNRWAKYVDQDYDVVSFAIRELDAYPPNYMDIETAEKNGYTAISFYYAD